MIRWMFIAGALSALVFVAKTGHLAAQSATPFAAAAAPSETSATLPATAAAPSATSATPFAAAAAPSATSATLPAAAAAPAQDISQALDSGIAENSFDPPGQQRLVRIYPIREADPSVIMDALRFFAGDADAVLDAEARAIIVRAQPEILEEIDGFITSYEQYVIAQRQLTKRTPSAGADSTLEDQLRAIEAEIRAHARSGAEGTGEQREPLRRLLEREFDLRQQIRRQQVKQLEARLDQVRRAIEERGKTKQQMVEQRLERMLANPSDARQPALPADPQTHKVPAALPDASAKQLADLAGPISRRPTQVSDLRMSAPSSLRLPPETELLAIPGEVANARQDVSHARLELERIENLRQLGEEVPEDQLREAKIRLDRATQALDQAQRRFELCVQLLRMNADYQRLERAYAEQAYARAKTSYGANVLTQQEVAEKQRDLEQAELQVRHAETLLKYFEEAASKGEEDAASPLTSPPDGETRR